MSEPSGEATRALPATAGDPVDHQQSDPTEHVPSYATGPVQAAGWTLADRYTVLDRLGSGGMAEVFRAHDEQLDRDVAVKVFRTPVDEPGNAHAPERRETELHALAQLTHPNLITLYDANLAGASPAFLVTELVTGPDLAARIAEGPLPEPLARTVGCQIADALAYVHASGMVHRDVKPANILLGTDGPDPETAVVRARLSDFGIVRVLDDARMTAAEFTLGTASYLAPEQARGGDVGPAADVYSLGLVLIEMLTGRRSFDGPMHEALAARLVRGPELPAGLPQPWPGLLAAMTAADPARRPGAAEVADSLRTAVAPPPPPTLVPPPAPSLVPPLGPVARAAAGPPPVVVPPPAAIADPGDGPPRPPAPHGRAPGRGRARGHRARCRRGDADAQAVVHHGRSGDRRPLDRADLSQRRIRRQRWRPRQSARGWRRRRRGGRGHTGHVGRLRRHRAAGPVRRRAAPARRPDTRPARRARPAPAAPAPHRRTRCRATPEPGPPPRHHRHRRPPRRRRARRRRPARRRAAPRRRPPRARAPRHRPASRRAPDGLLATAPNRSQSLAAPGSRGVMRLGAGVQTGHSKVRTGSSGYPWGGT